MASTDTEMTIQLEPTALAALIEISHTLTQIAALLTQIAMHLAEQQRHERKPVGPFFVE